MVRKTLSVIGGVVAAVVIITVVQWLGTRISPLPAGVDISDPSAIEIGDIPLVNMLWVLASYAVGALLGGEVAAKIAPDFMPWNAGTVGLLFTLASIMNLMLIPSPLWFAVINLLMMIPLALLGGWLVLRYSGAIEVASDAAPRRT